jgi:proline iminopeptidase
MLQRFGRFLLWFLLFVEPPVVGGLAFFVVGPRLTDSVAFLSLFTVVLHLFASFISARAALGPNRQGPVMAVTVAWVVIFVAGGWALLFNRPPPFEGPVGERGVRFRAEKVKSGSILAVAKLGPEGGTPVVFLHGGPGRPVLASDVTFFQSVAERGVQVVLFDQAGVGESAPLPSEEISIERAVADLEALRELLGAEKISLVGQSWGARLAVEYAGRHVDRVERMVVTGGAPIGKDKALWKFDNRRTALKKDPSPLSFRLFFATAMLNASNPRLAGRFATKGDLNAAMAALVPSIMKRSVCAKDGDAVKEAPEIGGLDGSQFLRFRPLMEGIATPLAATPPPALVLRPECDFAAWPVAREYRDALKAKVVYVEGAGHALWPYRADVVRDVLVAWFKGEELPLKLYEGDADPAGT